MRGELSEETPASTSAMSSRPATTSRRSPAAPSTPAGTGPTGASIRPATSRAGRSRRPPGCSTRRRLATTGSTPAATSWPAGRRQPVARGASGSATRTRPIGWPPSWRVSDRAVATSGDYERGDHIADPRTGRAATGLRSVTVVGPRLAFTDAYATAVFAMGLDGLTWLAAHGRRGRLRRLRHHRRRPRRLDRRDGALPGPRGLTGTALSGRSGRR